MKKSIRNDYCVRQFTAFNDELRPRMNNVNFRGGFIYASDSHCLAKVNADFCMHKYKDNPDYPEAQVVLDEHKSHKVISYNADDLFYSLMKTEVCYVPKMCNCDECGGHGEKTCDHCNSEFECNKCDGTGEIESKELKPSGKYDVFLNDYKFSRDYIERIVKTAIILEVKIIKVSFQKEYQSVLFYIGDFTILLMPKMLDN